MRRGDVIARLCEIGATVAKDRYRWRMSADCLCAAASSRTFAYDENVLDYIAEAVKQRLERDGPVWRT